MSETRRSPSARQGSRAPKAFTLVEVLVVIIIVGIMAAMVLTATAGVNRTAREARTRSILAAVDSVIQDKYDSLRYRAFAVEIPNLFQGVSGTEELGFEVLASEKARVRLQMLRDLMRLELPDRFSDIYEFRDSSGNATFVTGDVAQIAPTMQARQIAISAAANLIKLDTATSTVVGTRAERASRRRFDTSWGGVEPAVQRAFRDRLAGQIASNTSIAGRINISTADLRDAVFENQSAECLYLIMSTTFVGGTSAIDAIPTQNIGDTDGDGLEEILDGWGRPLGFIRWPIGYQDPEGFVNTATADDFDLYNTDFAYGTPTAGAFSATSPRLAVDVHTGASVNPWALRPLILSAGEDGEFGIALNPINSVGGAGQELGAFQYYSSVLNWPADLNHMGDEFAGRNPPAPSTYPAVDPYLRLFIKSNDPGILNRSTPSSYTTTRRLPGEDLASPTASSRFDARRSDNITNYALQVTQ